MTTKEYRPLQQANTLGKTVAWTALPQGPAGIYDSEADILVVRQHISNAEITVGLAEALAGHDIAHYGPNPVHGNDVHAIAVSRLLPDDVFTEAYRAFGGGISALSRFFNLPPVVIRHKLEALAASGRPPRTPLRIVRPRA